MKTRKRLFGRRDGAALFAIMGLILICVLGLAVMQRASIQRTFMARKLSDRIRAQMYAEAGIARAYAALAADWDKRTVTNLYPNVSYGEGSYDVTVMSPNADLAVLHSRGVCNDTTVDVVLDLQNLGGGGGGGGGSPGPAPGFEYAILSGGKLTWTGSGITDVQGGVVHANNDVKMTGSAKLKGTMTTCGRLWSTGTTKIQGDATAKSWKGKSPGNVTGTATTKALPLVPIPDIDLTPYYNEALKNGEVYNGNVHISTSGTIQPKGGIMWVNGKLKISGSGKMIGCFIATGDLDITGSGDQEKVNGYPAFVSRDGDIDLAGSGRYHGLMYAKNGEFEKTGSGAIKGSIICAGDFKRTGSWDQMEYEDSTPVPPGSGGTPTPSIIAVSAWQK